MFDALSLSDLLLAALIFGAALLYSSVGHGGASGYLAAMALFSLAPAVMKPSALALNIVVSLVATIKFTRAGAFSWPAFWPFALLAVPAAYVGGMIQLPPEIYRPLLGLVLLYAGWRSWQIAPIEPHRIALPRLPLMIAAGAALGLLSGLTGVGGGIFLSPLLLLFAWAETRVVSGVAAAFILVNSVAGLAGQFAKGVSLPPAISLWAIAALAGGLIGAELGARRLGTPALKRLLAAVLLVAGLKMLLS
jgi:hypothetical protein